MQHIRWLGTLLVLALGAALAQPLPEGAVQGAPEGFYDLSETHWAYDAVTELTELGILTGYPDGRFDGTRTPTRYELAVVAARLVDYIGSVEGVTRGDAGLAGAAALQNVPFEARVARLEAALEDATPLSYTRRLEARVARLEAALSGTEARSVEGGAGTLTNDEELREIVLPLAKGEVRFGTRPAYPFYVGISPGVVSTAGDVYLSVQAGYDNLVGAVGPAARLTFNGGNRELRLSVDALAKLDALVEELKLYGGLGLGATVRPSGGSFLLEAPFGTEYLVTERVGLFLQLTTSYSFAPVNDVDAELMTGINLRF